MKKLAVIFAARYRYTMVRFRIICLEYKARRLMKKMKAISTQYCYEEYGTELRQVGRYADLNKDMEKVIATMKKVRGKSEKTSSNLRGAVPGCGGDIPAVRRRSW